MEIVGSQVTKYPHVRMEAMWKSCRNGDFSFSDATAQRVIALHDTDVRTTP